MASKSRVLYIGITGNLNRRVFEHKNDLLAGFTRRYKVHRLVHFERFTNVSSAIAREKELKGWRREKKVQLIESENRYGRIWRSFGTKMSQAFLG